MWPHFFIRIDSSDSSSGDIDHFPVLDGGDHCLSWTTAFLEKISITYIYIYIYQQCQHLEASDQIVEQIELVFIASGKEIALLPPLISLAVTNIHSDQ